MGKKLKFSIIIPTHKGGDSLSRCLRNIIEQISINEAWEIIVVYDGLAQKGEKNLRHEKVSYFYIAHRGPAAARNFGVSKAGGDILIFIDDDVYPKQGWVKAVEQAWDDFPDFIGIGGMIAQGPQDSIYSKLSADLFNWFDQESSFEGQVGFLCSCNASYKRESFMKIGGFDENFGESAGEDRDLNVRIIKAGGKLKLDKRIEVYHNQSCGLLDFVKRYYCYGKVSPRVYSSHPELKKLPKASYNKLIFGNRFGCPGFGGKTVYFSLVILSQLAVFSGYCSFFVEDILFRKNLKRI